jgi:hypothetical protein
MRWGIRGAAMAPLLMSIVVVATLPTSSAQAALPPRYLAVPQFQQCLATRQAEQHQSWCVPDRKARACPKASWQQLQSLKQQGQLRPCKHTVR